MITPFACSRTNTMRKTCKQRATVDGHIFAQSKAFVKQKFRATTAITHDLLRHFAATNDCKIHDAGMSEIDGHFGLDHGLDVGLAAERHHRPNHPQSRRFYRSKFDIAHECPIPLSSAAFTLIDTGGQTPATCGRDMKSSMILRETPGQAKGDPGGDGGD